MGLRWDFDTGGLIGKIQAVGKDATLAGFDSMKEGAKEIQKLAQDYAPVDEHDLEKAIKVEIDPQNMSAYVMIDPLATDGRGVSIALYGMYMHEGLAPYGSGRYELGPESEKKAASKDVGGKFLERAYENSVRDIVNKIGFRVKRLLRG